MTTRRPPRPDCRYQEWLTRVTRWGYRSVNGPILLMEHERQQVVASVKPIRTRPIHKNADPAPSAPNTQNAGGYPRRLEDREAPNTVVQKKTSLHTKLRQHHQNGFTQSLHSRHLFCSERKMSSLVIEGLGL